MKLVFSQNSMYHLYHLAVLIAEKTGRKYQLSNNEDMTSLIRYCNQSNSTTVCRQYDAFLHSLEPDTLREIEHLTGMHIAETAMDMAG